MVGRLVHLHVGRRRHTGAGRLSVCSRRLITLYPVYCTTCPGHSMNPIVCVSLLSIPYRVSTAECRVPCPGGGDCALPSIFLRLFEWGPTNCARWSVPALLALTVSFTVPYS